ncbi:MAG: excinuclease ABC subunit UvrC [Myxococcales bacterium]|nr:excinuclease ABC subunit UvrC [Myxococcales bacterium]
MPDALPHADILAAHQVPCKTETAMSELEPPASALRERLETLPTEPGVYVFRASDGSALYVGKARNLRARVRGYFQPSSTDTRFFVRVLHTQVADLETFVTQNEKEAALLEAQLVRSLRPRWNFKLRDDKDFLSIRIDRSQPYPRLEIVRRPRPDGARYHGPFDSASAARQTLRLVNRHFRLRTCTDREMHGRRRPCLQHQIGRCPAPCVLPVDRDEYLAQLDAASLFLDGRHDELVAVLAERMRESAAAMDFERAAAYRDQIRAIERVRQEQHVVAVRDVDQDVVGLARDGDRAQLALVRVRAGKVVDVRTWNRDAAALPDDELVASFVSAYYEHATDLPDEVLLPVEIEASEGLAACLSERAGRRVVLRAARRGAGMRLLRLAARNAANALQARRRSDEDIEAKLRAIQRRLGLPRLPRRIECIDVSHHGGRDTVAAIVALRDGAPDRARYRTFRIRTSREGDDYGAMREVLGRRLRRARAAQKGWELPDLLLVDGGKGQLTVARTVLAELGVDDLPVVALAKERERPGAGRVLDRIYVVGRKNPVPVGPGASALLVLVHARDEAHRASNVARLRVQRRRALRSRLLELPGIGPKTARRLLRALGSLRAVLQADPETLRAAGATPAQVRSILAACDADVGSDSDSAAVSVSASDPTRADPSVRRLGVDLSVR